MFRECRHEPGGKAGEQGDRDEKRQHGAVRTEFHPWRQGHADQRGNHVDADDRQRETHGTTEDRKDEALREQLADDPSAACAEGEADRELAIPRDRTGQQQVHHIRASDEQDEHDATEQQEQIGAHLSDIQIPKRRHAKAETGVRRREVSLQPARQRVDPIAGLFDRDPRPEPTRASRSRRSRRWYCLGLAAIPLLRNRSE